MPVNNTLKRITTKAKQIRKTHPKMKWTDAVKTASKEISGTKAKTPVKKKVAGVGKVKRKRTAPVMVSSTTKKIVSTKKKIGSVGIPQVDQGLKILANIDKLEAKRTAARGKDAKDFIQYGINAEHAKLKSLQRTLKNVR